jgi:hypothetical protein
MNKLTKIGVSALCGSLAGFSAANAGDLTVSGGVDMTWMSFDDETTGNPIGIGSNVTFAGSGELENGWSVDLSIANTNAQGLSNANVTIGIPALGDIRVDQGTTGTGIHRIDDVTPAVWEEAYGTGLSTGAQLVNGTSAGTTIEWTPNMTPDGLTARLAYSPNACHSNTADKTSGGVCGGTTGSGWDVMLSATSDMIGMDGLTLYGGISEVEQYQNGTATNGDKSEKTVAAKYAVGSFTLGYQWGEKETGTTGATQYESDAWGVTFSVNDDLSIGYNHFESEQTNSTNVTLEADSVQLSYTMGGATFTLAEAQADNMKYSTASPNDRDATSIKLALAF